VNAEYLRADTDTDLDDVLGRAVRTARSGRPVMVEVAIDYSQKTYFTRGVVATNFWRLPLGDRVRILGRAAARHISGALTGSSRRG
jgi:acetolactate synthase-1/2/3 large subunit